VANQEKSSDMADLGKQFADYLQRIRDDKELYKLKAQVAKALSHESRLMIIDALREKDMCVGELTDLIGVDQSTVSKHLSILKNIGLITDSKERSNKVFYHLTMPGICYFSELSMELIKQSTPRAGFHALRQALLERK
jgi:DNA-binding transcriptional ArsR family regulator